MSVQFRHHHIAQDQVRLLTLRQLHSFLPVLGFDGRILTKSKQGSDVPPHLRFIFNDQDFFHGSLQKTGSLTVTVVPSPILLCNCNSPPWRSAQRFTSSRPSPVPGRVPTLLPR